MRYVSLFSGIEAASVAWEPLGWEPVAFSEIEPFPCELLKQRYPGVPNLGDITQIDWKEVLEEHGPVDLVVGGSPCQSFSVAGNREGLKGESGLMFEYIRAIREIMPRCFVWENVPGALSSEGGAAFGQLLREMDELGYGLAWRVLDAQFFGVAQRRRRVFLVGCLGDPGCAAEVLLEPEGLRWDNPPVAVKRQELAARARAGALGGGAGASGQDDGGADGGGPRRVRGEGAETSPPYTLLTRCGKPGGGGKGPLVQEDVRATLATTNMQTLFQPVGFPHNAGGNAAGCGCAEELAPTLRSAKNGENAVCYESMTPWDNQTSRVYPTSGAAPTLKANPNGGTHSPTVCYSIPENAIGRPNSGTNGPMAYGPEEASPTLRASSNVPATCYAIQGDIARGAHMGQNGKGYSDDGSAYTLNTIDVHAVCFQQNQRDEVRLVGGDGQTCGELASSSGMKNTNYVCMTDTQPHSSIDDEICGTLARHASKDAPVVCMGSYDEARGAVDEELSGTLKVGGKPPAVAFGYVVRRLMPVECERLQGFPDGWTDIEFKGKPASDTARYKALGNSMAVPVMCWIGERIQQYETKRRKDKGNRLVAVRLEQHD